MKKSVLAGLLCLALILCTACGQASALEKDIQDDVLASGSWFDFTGDQLIGCSAVVRGKDAGTPYLQVTKAQSGALEKADAKNGTLSALTWKQMQEMGEPLSAYAEKNSLVVGNAIRVHLSFGTEIFQQLDGSHAYEVYSLRTQEVTAGTGTYAGSQNYGVLTLQQPQGLGKAHTLVIDD